MAQLGLNWNGELTSAEKILERSKNKRLRRFLNLLLCSCFFTLCLLLPHVLPRPHFTDSILIFRFPVASSKTSLKPHHQLVKYAHLDVYRPFNLEYALDGSKQGLALRRGQIAQPNQAFGAGPRQEHDESIREGFHRAPLFLWNLSFERLPYVVLDTCTRGLLRIAVPDVDHSPLMLPACFCGGDFSPRLHIQWLSVSDEIDIATHGAGEADVDFGRQTLIRTTSEKG